MDYGILGSQCPIKLRYLSHDLKTGLKVRLSDHRVKIEVIQVMGRITEFWSVIQMPFNNRTVFNHLNTLLVQYSDPNFSAFKHLIYME